MMLVSFVTTWQGVASPAFYSLQGLAFSTSTFCVVFIKLTADEPFLFLLGGLLTFTWLNYFSVSSLIASSIYVLFGKPGAGSLLGEAAGFFGFQTNGWVSLAILLLISTIALLLTFRNLYKEDISG